MEDYIIHPADYFEKDILDYFYPSNDILPGFPL